MRLLLAASLLSACLLTACHTCCHVPPLPAARNDFMKEFQARAAKFNAVVSLPQFETTTNEIAATVKATIAGGNAALDRIGALKPGEVAFANTVRALDDAGFQS